MIFATAVILQSARLRLFNIFFVGGVFFLQPKKATIAYIDVAKRLAPT